MSTPLMVLYYALLFIHVASILGALAISLMALIKRKEARGLWHASLSALIAGLALTALLSWQAEVNEMKIGVKLAVSIAVLALSLLVARREKEAAEAKLLSDAAAGQPTPGKAAEVSLPEETAAAPAEHTDPRLVEDKPEQEPVDTVRPLLGGVAVGVIINTLLAVFW